MSGSLVANRYARALFRLYDQSLEPAKKQLEALAIMAALFEEKKIKGILVSPVIKKSHKKEIIDVVLEKAGGDETLQRFTDGVIEAGRVPMLQYLHTAFSEILNEKEGVVDANVVSVVPLNADQMENLSRALGQSSGKQINLTGSVDPAILGGLVIKIGNNLIDLSLKSKLEAMAQNAVR